MHCIQLGEKKKDLVEERYLFGRRYGIKDMLKYGGVGSPKVIYDSGIAVFDSLDRSLEGEIPYASFEHRRKGLIIRFNRNQRLAKVGILYEDLRLVRMTGFRVNIVRSAIAYNRRKVVHRGELELLDVTGQSSKFLVTVNSFKGIMYFFQKTYFKNSFEYMQSPLPPEKEKFFG